MKKNNIAISKNEKKEKKTWLDLSAEQLQNLSTKSACMYGAKSKNSLGQGGV